MRQILIFSIFTLLLFALSCKKKKGKEDTLPPKMTIDVPSSINDGSSGKIFDIQADTLGGEEIYQNVRLFVFVGVAASQFIQEVVDGIRTYKIDRALETSFEGDDGREKDLVVSENTTFEGNSYELALTISDAGSKALQVFWNTNPVEGVAIADPYILDQSGFNLGVKYKVHYSAAETTYEEQMIVEIDNFPIIPNDNGSMDNLKLFVGKNGTLLDIIGNSNHPQIGSLFVQNEEYQNGANYAFVAKSDPSQNIAVIELGIPPSSLSNSSQVLTNYAVQTVLSDLLQYAFPSADSTILANYTADAAAPGYFDSGGFASAGENPNNGKDYGAITDLSGLTPYSPSSIKNLTISWGN